MLNLLRHWMAVWATPLHGTLGERGEQLAERTLRAKGFRIIGRRVRTVRGELDLVAKQGRTWVFVEVKTRRADELGESLAAVTPQKQRQLTRLALAYLRRRHCLEEPARFDVVGICWPSDQAEPQIQHVVNAFEATGQGGMFS